jgi:hypothetical protein
MGAKTWMLVYADGDAATALSSEPQLDLAATLQLASNLFPTEKLEQMGAGSLSYTCPPDDEIHIGCFPGVAVVAAKEFGGDYPSRLSPRFLKVFPERSVLLHAMHSVVDWFAFAKWSQGRLVRSLSLSPDSGVLEDIGAKLPFEQPFWAGEHPAVDPDEEPEGYPLPFHPLELGEEALLNLFGYQLEGPIAGFDPESIPLMRLKRLQRRSWKFWQ